MRVRTDFKGRHQLTGGGMNMFQALIWMMVTLVGFLVAQFGFNPWVGKIPWRREWQPTLVFLPGEFMDRGACP